MERISVMEEELEVVEVLGQEALFTELRVDPATVPEGVHCYELRHGDNDSFPATIEKKVTVNYFGAILLTKELLKEDDYLSLTPDDFGFVGETRTVKELKPELQSFEEGRSLAAYLMLTFNMSIKEADTLISYLDAHDYAVGHRESNGFFLRDANGEWRKSSIDEVIDLVCDWNYALIQSTESDLESLTGEEQGEQEEFYQNLLEEGKLLDSLFDRTKYGKRAEELAEEIAKEVAESSIQPEKLEEGVKHAVEKIKKFRHEEAE